MTACRPSTSSSISTGVAATWRILANPAAFNRALVFGPMPGSQRFGSGWMNCFSCPPGTFSNAAGLFNLDAIWLMSLFEATPSLTVIFRDCRMALLIVSAISIAGFL